MEVFKAPRRAAVSCEECFLEESCRIALVLAARIYPIMRAAPLTDECRRALGTRAPLGKLWRQASHGDPSERRDDGVFEEGRWSFIKAPPPYPWDP